MHNRMGYLFTRRSIHLPHMSSRFQLLMLVRQSIGIPRSNPYLPQSRLLHFALSWPLRFVLLRLFRFVVPVQELTQQ